MYGMYGKYGIYGFAFRNGRQDNGYQQPSFGCNGFRDNASAGRLCRKQIAQHTPSLTAG